MREGDTVLIDRWHDAACWTTESERPQQQFPRWCAFVNQAFLSWSIGRTACSRFPAFIREGRFEDCRLSNLTSALPAVEGVRGRAEIACDKEALYNLLYIVDGAQELVIEQREVALPRGHFVLWDSTRPMRFRTGERLRQITLALPHARLHRVLPDADRYTGHAVAARGGLGRLFAEHLIALDACFGDLPRSEAPQVLDAAIDLLAAALVASIPLDRPDRKQNTLRALRHDIERHLADPELSIAGIAARNGITPRQLHRLFAASGTTPARWIQQRRLERCRHELASARGATTSVTAIAFRWGFSDSSAFCRAFKRAYGLAPTQYRAQCASAAQALHC